MKVLKVTYEIPLAARNTIASMKRAGEVVAELTKVLEAAGFEGTVREESIVTRPGGR